MSSWQAAVCTCALASVPRAAPFEQLPQRWHLPFCTEQSSGKRRAPAADTGGRSTGTQLEHTGTQLGHSCPLGACGRCGATSAPTSLCASALPLLLLHLCSRLDLPWPPLSCPSQGHLEPPWGLLSWQSSSSQEPAGVACGWALLPIPAPSSCGPQAPTQPGHCQDCQQRSQRPQARAVRCSTAVRAQLFAVIIRSPRWLLRPDLGSSGLGDGH